MLNSKWKEWAHVLPEEELKAEEDEDLHPLTAPLLTSSQQTDHLNWTFNTCCQFLCQSAHLSCFSCASECLPVIGRSQRHVWLHESAPHVRLRSVLDLSSPFLNSWLSRTVLYSSDEHSVELKVIMGSSSVVINTEGSNLWLLHQCGHLKMDADCMEVRCLTAFLNIIWSKTFPHTWNMNTVTSAAAAVHE